MFTENIPSGFFLNPHGGNPGMDVPGGGGGGIFGMPGSGRRQGGDQPKKSKVFTPVTLKMVQLSQPRPDDVCEFEGEPINDIIIVGRLLRKIEEPMRTQLEINDNTHTFTVLFYHKGENQVPTALRNFNYEQFSYAKIYGNIRVFKEEKAIVGTHIKRIEKFDELTNHFLSVYLSYCIKKKGILKPRELAMDQNGQDQQNTGMIIDQGNSMNIGGPTMNSSYNKFNNTNHSSNNLHLKGMNTMNEEDLRKQIQNVMQEFLRNKQFVSKTEIFSMMQNNCTQQQLDSILNKMANEGIIANAHDNEHFFFVQ